MSSYLKSEIYRLVHYKWTYLFIAICSLLLLSSNVVLAVVGASDSKFLYDTTAFSFTNAYTSMTFVFILCMIVALMVFGNEHGNHTLKNSVTYGINRASLFFGKFLVQALYSLLAMAVIIGIHIASGYALLENSGSQVLDAYMRACLACLPFFIFGLAATNAFSFMTESTGSASAAASVLLFVFPLVCGLLAKRFELFKVISSILPWHVIGSAKYNSGIVTMYWDRANGIGICWANGMIQTMLILMIGYLLFRRKEIK